MAYSMNVNDERFEDFITDALNENLPSDYEIEYDSDNNEYDVEEIVECDSEYASEQSASEEDDDIDLDSGPLIKGKNGYKWSSNPPPSTRTPARNIVLRIPGAKGEAKKVKNETEAWNIFLQMK